VKYKTNEADIVLCPATDVYAASVDFYGLIFPGEKAFRLFPLHRKLFLTPKFGRYVIAKKLDPFIHSLCRPEMGLFDVTKKKLEEMRLRKLLEPKEFIDQLKAIIYEDPNYASANKDGHFTVLFKKMYGYLLLYNWMRKVVKCDKALFDYLNTPEAHRLLKDLDGARKKRLGRGVIAEKERIFSQETQKYFPSASELQKKIKLFRDLVWGDVPTVFRPVKVRPRERSLYGLTPF